MTTIALSVRTKGNQNDCKLIASKLLACLPPCRVDCVIRTNIPFLSCRWQADLRSVARPGRNSRCSCSCCSQSSFFIAHVIPLANFTHTHSAVTEGDDQKENRSAHTPGIEPATKTERTQRGITGLRAFFKQRWTRLRSLSSPTRLLCHIG